MTIRLLVVEDERAIQLALTGLFKKEGYDVTVADGARPALERIQAGAIDLVVTDLSLGRDGTGMDVLRAVKATHPDVPVILITAHGSERVAVEAMKAGADDYVPKPFDNDELRLVVRRALERTALVRENRMLLERVERERGLGAMIGTGERMREVFSVIQKVAETDLTVLVRGESGTGKELVAEALHQRSSRSKAPFVAVNCAAISRELVESELFGHEKGAFTGATARRVGRFEAADHGTLFLDEIGDMPLETQAKVLRVLEERKVERVGSHASVAVDVRVVAATHRDLEADVQKGRFRGDLFFRLSVVPIVLPPLRDRPEDIPLLVQRFLSRFGERLGRPAPRVSAEALQKLAAHPFPGNVRELRNVVEQAAALASGGTLEAADIRLAPAPADAGASFVSGTGFSDAKRRHVEAFERRFLREALDAHGGNVSRTAQAIGLARQSLQQKLRELGMRADEDG